MKEDLSSQPPGAKPKDELNERVAGLSPAKRALLELKLKKDSGESRKQAIPRRTERVSGDFSYAVVPYANAVSATVDHTASAEPRDRFLGRSTDVA